MYFVEIVLSNKEPAKLNKALREFEMCSVYKCMSSGDNDIEIKCAINDSKMWEFDGICENNKECILDIKGNDVWHNN